MRNDKKPNASRGARFVTGFLVGRLIGGAIKNKKRMAELENKVKNLEEKSKDPNQGN